MKKIVASFCLLLFFNLASVSNSVSANQSINESDKINVSNYVPSVWHRGRGYFRWGEHIPEYKFFSTVKNGYYYSGMLRRTWTFHSKDSILVYYDGYLHTGGQTYSEPVVSELK